MSTKIILKERKSDGEISFNISKMKEIVDSEDREKLHELMSNLLDGVETVVHDKRWLMQIVGWTPERGMPLIDQARALRIIDRLDKIEAEGEVEFEFTSKDKRFIIDRLQSKEFKMRTPPIQYIRFLFDLEKQWDEKIITPEEEIES